jgi:hypothetical protein
VEVWLTFVTPLLQDTSKRVLKLLLITPVVEPM